MQSSIPLPTAGAASPGLWTGLGRLGPALLAVGQDSRIAITGCPHLGERRLGLSPGCERAGPDAKVLSGASDFTIEHARSALRAVCSGKRRRLDHECAARLGSLRC